MSPMQQNEARYDIAPQTIPIRGLYSHLHVFDRTKAVGASSLITQARSSFLDYWPLVCKAWSPWIQTSYSTSCHSRTERKAWRAKSGCGWLLLWGSYFCFVGCWWSGVHAAVMYCVVCCKLSAASHVLITADQRQCHCSSCKTEHPCRDWCN
jgi:hypothetical protein